MDKSTLFDLRLALEDVDMAMELSLSLDREIDFVIRHFDKTNKIDQVNIEEYQHKLKFINMVYHQQVLELEDRLKKVDVIAKKLYDAVR